jgi:hypothetical protein
VVEGSRRATAERLARGWSSVAGNPQWLFGYGSLVAQPLGRLTRAIHQDGFVADLHGYRRTWGVAMDNRIDLPSYKYYVDPVSGERPPVYVAFLDIEPVGGGSVNGVCVPVTPDQLNSLDRRERQYDRIDVGAQFALVNGPVWVYVGSPAGRERRRAGDRAGATVVAREYWDGVLQGFTLLGEGERLAYETSTSPCECPVVALSRRALPE